MTPTFQVEHGAIVMLTGRGSIRLSPESVTQLLDIWQREEAHGLYNELYERRRDLISAQRASLHVVEAIPVVRPITCEVRQLNPDAWIDGNLIVAGTSLREMLRASVTSFGGELPPEAA
jgi:hypothetical protein